MFNQVFVHLHIKIVSVPLEVELLQLFIKWFSDLTLFVAINACMLKLLQYMRGQLSNSNVH